MGILARNFGRKHICVLTMLRAHLISSTRINGASIAVVKHRAWYLRVLGLNQAYPQRDIIIALLSALGILNVNKAFATINGQTTSGSLFICRMKASSKI